MAGKGVIDITISFVIFLFFRAASVVYNFMDFKRLCDREMLPPLVIRKTIPLCMAQYERIFSTVRVPGEDHDQLVHYSSAVSKVSHMEACISIQCQKCHPLW